MITKIWGDEDEDSQHQTHPKYPRQGQLGQAHLDKWSPAAGSVLQVLVLGSLPHQPCDGNIPDIPALVPRSQLPNPLWGCVLTPAGREDPEEAAPWPGRAAGQGHRGILWSWLVTPTGWTRA